MLHDGSWDCLHSGCDQRHEGNSRKDCEGVRGAGVKPETRFSYEKSIRELTAERNKLREDLFCYRTAAMAIFDGLTGLKEPISGVSVVWVLSKLRGCFK